MKRQNNFYERRFYFSFLKKYFVSKKKYYCLHPFHYIFLTELHSIDFEISFFVLKIFVKKCLKIHGKKRRVFK